MPRHDCPADGCKVQVPQSQLACKTHWFKVSEPTRREVNAAYRSGDLGRHYTAMQDAIEEMNKA